MALFWHGGADSDREEIRAFAMACATLGHKLSSPPFLDREGIGEDGKKHRRLAWSIDGEDAKKTLDQWNSPAFRSANPDHPVTVMWQFWVNWKAARENEPRYAEWEFRRGRNLLSVPKSYSKEQIAEALKKL